MSFGVDYYPEHWPMEDWPADAGAMREAGIEIVRLAEFSWARLEPESEVFDFEWLDRAIDVLSQQRLRIILGTPTAAPPIWLVDTHPEVVPVDSNRNRRGFGGRHHDCQSNETYRAYVRRVVRTMARHFADNPHVVGWQVDNELGNSHEDLCYCQSCRERFLRWLEEKYGGIRDLNAAWGTVFWSQEYQRFDQIPLPFPTPNSHNPGLLLDWRRFRSDLVVDFLREQASIIREECPHHFVTHNYMSFLEKTDYFKLARELDFVSHDQYPIHFRPGRDFSGLPHIPAAALDLTRGSKNQSFWIMEQQSGATGWEIVSRSPRPGQLRLWTYQAVAHGADTVVFYRWRTALFGTEQFWEGILPHHGLPNRRHAEITATIRELTPLLKTIRGTTPKADVALLFSYDQMWALRVQSHHPELSYVQHVQDYYRAFHEANIPVDMISDQADLTGYSIVVAPLQFLVTSDRIERLRDYVAGGGHLVLTMRSGVKHWNNRVRPEQLPGRELSDLLGIAVQEYDCLRDAVQGIEWVAEYRGSFTEQVFEWCDIIEAGNAKVLAQYQNDYYAGSAAITEHAFGAGFAYYVGTHLGAEMTRRLFQYVADAASVKSILESPEGVEVTRRCSDQYQYLFALNHRSDCPELSIQRSWTRVIGDDPADNGKLTLAPYGVAVFQRETGGIPGTAE